MSGSYAGFPYAGGAYAGALAPGASPPSDVGNNLPTVTVALDDGTGTFPLDITQYVEIGTDGGPVTITRGREDEYGDVQASTCSLLLNNTDGRFTLGSTSIASPSPIYVDNQIRVTFAVGAVTSDRFTGYVQNWPTAWPGGGDKYAVTQVTAVDRLARMSRRVLRSIVEEAHLAATPYAYYTLGEPAASLTAGDTSGNGRLPLEQSGTGTAVVFGSATGPATDSLTAATYAAGKRLRIAFPGTPPTDFSFSAYFNTSSVSVPIFQGGTPSRDVLVSLDASGRIQLGGFGTPAAHLVTATAYNDGATHHVSASFNSGASQVTVYVDGVSAGAFGTTWSSASAGQDFYLTLGGDWWSSGTTFTGTLAHAAMWNTTLTAPHAASIAGAGLTGFITDSSDERIARYASYAGIATGDMVLQVGVVDNLPHVDIAGMSPLAAIALVNAAEQGLVFVRGDGKLVFQNRTHRASQTTGWTFDASPNLQGDVTWTTDMQHVTNHVTAARVGGAVQVARDAASITIHEQYPTSYDNLLMPTDAAALDLATWIVNTHAEPGARLPNATIDLMSSATAFRQTWLGRELSNRIQITAMPAQSPVATADLIVEGWTETLSNSEWTTTLNTTPFALETAWILGDSTYGVLDSTTILGY